MQPAEGDFLPFCRTTPLSTLAFFILKRPTVVKEGQRGPQPWLLGAGSSWQGMGANLAHPA